MPLPRQGDILGDYVVETVAYNGNSNRANKDADKLWENWNCTLAPRGVLLGYSCTHPFRLLMHTFTHSDGEETEPEEGAAKETDAEKGAVKETEAEKGAAKETEAEKGAAEKGAAEKGPAEKGAAGKGAAGKGADPPATAAAAAGAIVAPVTPPPRFKNGRQEKGSRYEHGTN